MSMCSEVIQAVKTHLAADQLQAGAVSERDSSQQAPPLRSSVDTFGKGGATESKREALCFYTQLGSVRRCLTTRDHLCSHTLVSGKTARLLTSNWDAVPHCCGDTVVLQMHDGRVLSTTGRLSTMLTLKEGRQFSVTVYVVEEWPYDVDVIIGNDFLGTLGCQEIIKKTSDPCWVLSYEGSMLFVHMFWGSIRSSSGITVSYR